MPEFISFNFVETDGKNCTGYMTIAKDGFWIHKEDAVKAIDASSNSLQQLKAEIAAILVRYDLMTSNPYCEVPKGLRIDMETLRQLSAV